MRRNLLITGIAVGALLMLGPIVGLLFTQFGMMKAFDDLSGEGIGDPHALSGHIGLVLMSTFIGAAAFLVGLVLLIICAWRLVTAPKVPLPPVPVPASSGRAE